MQIHWRRIVALVLFLITLVFGLVYGRSIYFFLRTMGQIGQEDATKDELTFGLMAFGLVLVGLIAVIKICTYERH